MGCITEREAALYARMAMIGVAILVGNHANDGIPLDLRHERAADAAVRARGKHRPIRLTKLIDGLFHQRRRRACLNARAAGHALRFHEWLHLARRYLGIEATAINGQCECSLNFLARPDTAA